MRVGYRAIRRRAFRLPLVCACRAFGQLPLVTEQVFKVTVVPLGRVVGPRTLNAAGHGVHALTAAERVFPAQALLFNARAFRLSAYILTGVSRTVRFAKGVAARC